jgi:hypothetical protein
VPTIDPGVNPTPSTVRVKLPDVTVLTIVVEFDNTGSVSTGRVPDIVGRQNWTVSDHLLGVGDSSAGEQRHENDRYRKGEAVLRHRYLHE